MEKQFLIDTAKRLAKEEVSSTEVLSTAKEFLRLYAGEKSSFFRQLQELPQGYSNDVKKSHARAVLTAYAKFLESGLDDGISVERKAQIDVVSDFLEQANTLIETKGVHPAAPCVLIGASLEEFLRNWIEEQGLSLGNSKPSIDSYSKVLREAELITKQDYKDITSWAGLRNHAAHGQWEEVSDKKRIALMMEGVNLFMRRYMK